jgi:cytochrome P450
MFVGVSHIVPHKDTREWGNNASEFDPFRTSPSVAAAYTNQYLHTTFSHGVHACPGKHIALMNIKLTLIVMFGKYDLSVPTGFKIPPIDFERATLAQRKGKCCLRMAPK